MMQPSNIRFLGVLCLAVPCVLLAWHPEGAEEERLQQIQQSMQAGDLRTARSGLLQALSLSPRDPRLYNLLGVIEAQENHFTAAETNFEQAIRWALRFTGAYLNLGRLYQEHPNEPRAREKGLGVYRKLLDFEPDNVEANYQAAWLLNRLAGYADSLAHLGRLPEEAQQRSQALALECADNAALGKAAQAEATGKKLLGAGDLTEADIVSIAPVLIKAHATDLAIRLFEGLAGRNLASPEAQRQLVSLYETGGRFQEARTLLEKSLEREQPSSAGLSQLARLAYRAGDREAALGYLAHARELDPGNAAVHFFFGMVCVELKLPPEAEKSLQEAVRLNPGDAYYNYALGAVLVNSHKPDEAIPLFRKYREERPKDPHGRFALGVACFEAYRMADARAEFLAIAEQPETRMGAHLYLGRLALREDNLDDAFAHLSQAVQANPSAAEAYAELGLAQIRLKEYPAALKTLARAVQLSPDDYRSNLHLLMLYQRTKDPRTAAQAERVEQLRKAGAERERMLLRTLQIQPY
jgi:tetratricopeptide (TPR) repeat protein